MTNALRSMIHWENSRTSWGKFIVSASESGGKEERTSEHTICPRTKRKCRRLEKFPSESLSRKKSALLCDGLISISKCIINLPCAMRCTVRRGSPSGDYLFRDAPMIWADSWWTSWSYVREMMIKLWFRARRPRDGELIRRRGINVCIRAS